jgi:hypothetical protein
MFTLVRQFITYNNDLYVVKRTIKEESKPIVDDWREHLQADMVLKKEGLLYFLQKVEEAQIVEEDNLELGQPTEN